MTSRPPADATQVGDPTLARFRARAEDAGARVALVEDTSALAELALELSQGGAVAVADNLSARHPDLVGRLGASALAESETADLTDLTDVAMGLAAGIRGVAETGSVLVDEHALPDRAVSMLSRTLVYALPRACLVDSLDEVAEWLATSGRGNGYRALVTGPSRSADIERSLTIGVQGPMAMQIALVGAWSRKTVDGVA